MLRGTILYFFKGFANAICCVMQYHVKNPYEDISGSLSRDWKFVSADIRRSLSKIQKG